MEILIFHGLEGGCGMEMLIFHCRRDGWRYRILICFLIFWGGRGMEISIFQRFFKVPGVPEGWKYYVLVVFSRFLKWKH